MDKADTVFVVDDDVSPRTVEVHRSRIMEKMKAASLLELMEMARADGLFEMTRDSKRKRDIQPLPATIILQAVQRVRSCSPS